MAADRPTVGGAAITVVVERGADEHAVEFGYDDPILQILGGPGLIAVDGDFGVGDAMFGEDAGAERRPHEVDESGAVGEMQSSP